MCQSLVWEFWVFYGPVQGPGVALVLPKAHGSRVAKRWCPMERLSPLSLEASLERGRRDAEKQEQLRLWEAPVRRYNKIM